MDLLGIRTAVVTETGRTDLIGVDDDGNPDYTKDNGIDAFINRAQIELCDRAPRLMSRRLHSEVIEVGDYELVVPLLAVADRVRMEDATSRLRLNACSMDYLLDEYAEPWSGITNSTPGDWAQDEGNRIVFLPPTDTAYTIFVHGKFYPEELAEPEDIATGEFDDNSDPLNDWTAGGSALADGVAANGWTYSNANDNVAHAAAGGTTALLQAVADQSVALVDGHLYRVVFTVSGMTTGNVRAQVGTGGAGGAGTARAQNKTWTEDIICDATGSADFELIPSDDFDGTVTSVSVKEQVTNWMTTNYAGLLITATRLVMAASLANAGEADQFDRELSKALLGPWKDAARKQIAQLGGSNGLLQMRG